MPLPSVEQFIGTDVTEQGFKDAQAKLLNYVGVEVSTKVEMENAVKPKADKIYVDQLVINANNNIINYKTEVELKAFTPTTTNYTAKALDTKKVWLWDGSKWNDTGLSELDLANNNTKSEINRLASAKEKSIEDYAFVVADDENNVGFGVNEDRSVEMAGAHHTETDKLSKMVWGIADEDGNVSTGATSDGGSIIAGLKHEQSAVSGVVDEFGNIVLVLVGGVLYQPEIKAKQIFSEQFIQPEISAFEDNGNIYIVNSGEVTQITNDGLNKNPVWAGDRIIFVSKKQRGVYKQYQYKDGIISRYYPNKSLAKYVQIILTGQSLAEGLANPYIDRQVVEGTYRIGGVNAVGTGASNLTGGILPMQDVNHESIFTGFMKTLGVPKMTASGSARGGTVYADLKKGAQYSVFENCISQAQLIHTADPKSFIPAIFAIHGEADGSLSNVNYDKNLREWLDDFNASIKAIKGSSSAVMLTCQTSSASGYKSLANRDQFTSPFLQLKASNENPDIFLVMPKYQYNYKDYAHPLASDTRHMGCMYAKVYKKVVIDGEDWKPLQPTKFTVSGNQIIVDFHVPVAPLQFDTATVVNPGNYGFDLTNAGSVLISSVEITDPNQITLTCSAPVPANSILSYAFYSGTQGVSGRVDGARGCLKDSDNTADLFNYMPLNNWCVTFKQILTF